MMQICELVQVTPFSIASIRVKKKIMTMVSLYCCLACREYPINRILASFNSVEGSKQSVVVPSRIHLSKGYIETSRNGNISHQKCLLFPAMR